MKKAQATETSNELDSRRNGTSQTWGKWRRTFDTELKMYKMRKKENQVDFCPCRYWALRVLMMMMTTTMIIIIIIIKFSVLAVYGKDIKCSGDNSRVC